MTFKIQEIKKVKKQQLATVQVVIAMYFLQKSLAYHIRKLDRWEVMGGKSSLIFYKTTDDRFVLKQMSRFEYLAFLDFASLYNSGMSMEFLITENLFYNKKIRRLVQAACLRQRGGQELSELGDQEGCHLPGQPPDDGLQPPGRHLL